MTQEQKPERIVIGPRIENPYRDPVTGLYESFSPGDIEEALVNLRDSGDKGECRHHWMIESPEGGFSKRECSPLP